MKKADYQNVIRVIGGKFRGRKIPVLNIAGLRPTGDRLRETLFNWLMFSLQNSRCLDLFAGSGALGLEALSRGAAEVFFIDQSQEVIQQIKKNFYRMENRKCAGIMHEC